MINIINDLVKHPNKRYRTRSLDQIEIIVVHHFASTVPVEEVARWHVNDNGWPGIGYHFVIGFSGEVNLTNQLRTISYHCGGHNTRSVGIALQGDWSGTSPFDCQYDALIEAITMVRWAVGRDIPVFPHSAFRPTECPGDFIRDWLIDKYPVLLPLVRNPREHPDHIANDDDYDKPDPLSLDPLSLDPIF